MGWPARAYGNPNSTDILHIPLAISAGLGELGKHGSMISEAHGSNVRLATVLTDVPMAVDRPVDIGVDDVCQVCRRCVDDCPPRAIVDDKQLVRGERKWYVDFDRCVPYFTKTYGCSICIEVCPWSESGRGPTISRQVLARRERTEGAKTTMTGRLSIGLFVVLSMAGIAPPARAQSVGDPALTEVWEPVPPTVDPGDARHPPSDAIVLFGGGDLAAWESADGDAAWTLADDVVTVAPGTGDISTREAFGDVQLHLEWRSPTQIEGAGQERGNSGVYLMGRYEVQVLDSYESRTYSNGQAGSIYKQFIPLVNATRPPGEWQTYDIIFMAPRFESDGTLQRPATMTVLHNGVLIQNHVTVKGTVEYIGQPQYESHRAKEPLMLQDHSNLVSYRNVWLRELDRPSAQ